MTESQDRFKNQFQKKQPKILAQASQSKENDCVPYWNNFCKEISSKLWLPTEAGSLELDSGLLSSISTRVVKNSWFLLQEMEPENWNKYKIYSPSYTISHAKCGEREVIKARKIRIYPTTHQKSIFWKWLGISRKVYNLTIEHLKLPKDKREKHWMGAKKVILSDLPEYAKEVPYQVKSGAVEDAYKARNTCCKKGGRFELKYRTRKDLRQSCSIPKTALTYKGIYNRIVGKLKMSENLPALPLDSRLILDHGKWFIVIPFKESHKMSENQGRIVALDPGIRTFMTGFSENKCFKIGHNAFNRIQRLCKHMDTLISKKSKAKSRKKSSMKKALHRMQWKLRNLVEELHYKTARYLVDRFDIILLPKFETSQMGVKNNRKLLSKTVRNMQTLSFYQFKCRLKHVASQFGKLVVDVNEAYTSKTVSWTGEVKQIGSSKTIKSTGIIVDRDINGARGILLRALSEQTSLRNQFAPITS